MCPDLFIYVSHVGTPDYLAPEILLKSTYGPAVDWWALGVMIFELLVGITPFDGDASEQIYDNILHRRIRWPQIPSEMSTVAKDLISRFLTLSAADRFGSRGIDEIKAHPFFDGIKWETLHLKNTQFLPALEDPTDTKYFDGRNAVFYSPLEVSLQGGGLETVHLGGSSFPSKVVSRDILESSVVDHIDDVDGFLSKAFWNLDKLNQVGAENLAKLKQT